MYNNNWYEILGIPMDASFEEIKNAYKEKVKEFHPDLNPSEDNNDKMHLINEAYNILRNDNTRKMYDKFLVTKNNYQNNSLKNNYQNTEEVIISDNYIKEFILKKLNLSSLLLDIENVSLKSFTTSLKKDKFWDPYYYYILISYKDKNGIIEIKGKHPSLIDINSRETYQRYGKEIESIKLVFELTNKYEFKGKFDTEIVIIYDKEDKSYGIYNLMKKKYMVKPSKRFKTMNFANFSGYYFRFRDTTTVISYTSMKDKLGAYVYKRGIIRRIDANYKDIRYMECGDFADTFQVIDYNNKFGLYSYKLGYRSNYFETFRGGVTLSSPYIYRTVIPCTFDSFGNLYKGVRYKQDLYNEDEYIRVAALYIEYFSDGKMGLYDIYNSKTLVPPIFDGFSFRSDISMSTDGELAITKIDNFLDILYGHIGDKKYKFENNQIVEIIETPMFLNEDVSTLRRKLLPK